VETEDLRVSFCPAVRAPLGSAGETDLRGAIGWEWWAGKSAQAYAEKGARGLVQSLRCSGIGATPA
jgi:hypothetical protein